MFVFHMKPWSGISVYMFNLAVADFLYVLTLPALIFYYFNKTDWIFGDAMCKLQRFIFHVNLYGSILFLTCISAHRYSGVVYPLKSLGRLKKKNAVYISMLVWLIVVLGISPILFYSGTGVRKNKTITCYDTTADEYLRSYFIYSMCTTVAMFCIPLVLILGCYGLIVRALIYKDLDNSPLRRKSIYLVIIVLTVFGVSYIPFHVMKTMNLRARLDFQTPEMCAFNDRVYATYQVTRGLASLNSCVDPILYFLAGDTFRRRLSRATRKASRRSEANLQSKSEDMTLNILSEFKQNGDTSLSQDAQLTYKAQCTDQCTSASYQPGLSPLAIPDLSGDVVVCKVARGEGRAQARAGHHPTPLLCLPPPLYSAATEAEEALTTAAALASLEPSIWHLLLETSNHTGPAAGIKNTPHRGRDFQHYPLRQDGRWLRVRRKMEEEEGGNSHLPAAAPAVWVEAGATRTYP
ncbi:P2Y purinoceptor 1 [Myotis davidii]|uniref:P2Y purinoceptor 1 n=2 Tax=Myotis davidii TaxID=225400 RepID=L5MF11_MYODS|nr:P2Y purinoceptor 1 [Myotis davidii]